MAETFLAAFRRRDAYDLARPDAAPWLYGIAANLIAGHRRAEVRMHRAFARTGQGPVAEVVTDGVEDRLAAVAAQRALAGGLAKLTAGEREALLLVAWAEFTYEQVAEALGVPLGTVRSRLHRARAKMRGLLRGHPAADIAEDEA